MPHGLMEKIFSMNITLCLTDCLGDAFSSRIKKEDFAEWFGFMRSAQIQQEEWKLNMRIK